MRLEWPIPWDTGAPMPHVLSSGHVMRLVYLVNEPDPEWDGSYVNLIDPADPHELAVVSFEECIIHKFGGPNDEVVSGHPLYGKGLEPYAAHEVVNSSWIVEQQQINSVHSQYSVERWKTCRHFLLLFHDDMFECDSQQLHGQSRARPPVRSPWKVCCGSSWMRVRGPTMRIWTPPVK